MGSLQDRIAVVTGASRGIGRAVCLELARRGAHVAALARDATQLRHVVDEIMGLGRRALALPGDVTAPDAVTAAIQRVREDLGPIDILVNSAGVAESAPFVKTDLELWRRHLDVNLTGTFLPTRAVIDGMLARKKGRIINVASTAGMQGLAYTTAYCASKHGVVGLTRALALEVATTGITVNAVCPGWTDTEMTRRAIANIHEKTGRDPDDARRIIEGMSPQKRLMTAEEVAWVVASLAADDAAGINGQAIVIDGGGCQK